MLKRCFTSTETVGLLGTGAQDGHLDFHAAPELCGTNFVSLHANAVTAPAGCKSAVQDLDVDQARVSLVNLLSTSSSE